MKLADMPLLDGLRAQDELMPLIAIMTNDEEFATALTEFLTKVPDLKDTDSIITSLQNNKAVLDGFLRKHLKTTCEMLSILNDIPSEDIEKKTLGEVTELIQEALRDENLVAFFVSRGTSVQAE